jgi:hypothetical protein
MITSGFPAAALSVCLTCCVTAVPAAAAQMATKPVSKPGLEEEVAQVHRIRITLTSKNVKALEKGEQHARSSTCPQPCMAQMHSSSSSSSSSCVRMQAIPSQGVRDLHQSLDCMCLLVNTCVALPVGCLCSVC